jgi:hypothetical protein
MSSFLSSSAAKKSQNQTHRDQNSQFFDRSNRHSLMSHTDSATLSTLPVETLHQIFDNLDGTTVLLSVRNVCQRLEAIVNNYNRYELDLTSISTSDFHHLLRVIRPEWVTVLSLSNAEQMPRQIGLFRSLIDIGLFTQLRSLTLPCKKIIK